MGAGKQAAKAFPLRAAGLSSIQGGFPARMLLGHDAEEGQPCSETSCRVCLNTHQLLTDSGKKLIVSSIKSLSLAQAENPLEELMQGKNRLRQEESGGTCD